MSRYLVFDIGCLECGQDSQPIGIFSTIEQAEIAKANYLTGEPNEFGSNWGRKEWFGQHEVNIYDMKDKKDITNDTTNDTTNPTA